ncbi:MAG: hypothetical protein CMI96_01480 [Pelagibacteraceae bacterium]|nr:hypothetical protein [Pelagibacteraceae bacterium]|tara:strand:+ start:3747 stop:4280 length:534 start_codon:yes stop_codon:yes gene_type:complete
MNFQDLIFPYDYIIIIISILLILISSWKGFINSILGLLTWIGSIIITIYSYNTLSLWIDKQLLNINILNQYEQITNLISIILSIPIIFLISLFILKRIRSMFSKDLDKQILGIIFDKFFGFIYGLVFSYLILSTFLYMLEKPENMNNLFVWILDNSFILNTVYMINKFVYAYFLFSL